MKRREEQAKEWTKGDPKGPEEHSLVKNKHMILNCGQKKTLLNGPMEGKARRAGQRATMAFRRVVIALTSHTKVQVKISTKTKASEMTKKSYTDDEKSCFCTWDDNQYAWQSRPCKKKGTGKR